jgi:small subunit ribosomal protein S18
MREDKDRMDRGMDRGDRDRGGDRELNLNGTGIRRTRRRGCAYCSDEALIIDYKDPQALRYFVTERGKIVPRRISGVCAKHQRELTRAIKRARNVAIMPFTSNE